MKPSPQQVACYTATAETADSLTVDSVAGSGKTTTLAGMSQRLQGTGRSTSFSAATVKELSKKMSQSFPSRTMHGDGLDTLKSHLGNCEIDQSNTKTYDYVKQAVTDAKEPWTLIAPILSLVDQAQTAGIVPDHNRFLLADVPANWEALADQFDIQYNPTIQCIARKALLHSNTVALKDRIISFNDMIYLPVFFSMRVRQHKTIIVDERQDLSPIQFALLQKQLRKGGRIIAAGDPNQAIYGFRGAMTNSYSLFAEKFGAQQLKLTVSFRCPQAVVLEAQQYVPEIESAPSAPVGDVITHENLPFDQLPPIILCRNNAPLIRLALKLFVQGKSVEVAGRDIGAGLKSLTKRIASGKSADHMKSEEFLRRLEKWAAREIERKPKSRPRVQDKLEAFKALCEHHRNLGDIRKHIDGLYVEPNNRKQRPAEYHFSTIHRAKGREWPEILFLDPQLIPAPWAEADWEQQQELNLAYVGVTRAQSILHYARSSDIHE